MISITNPDQREVCVIVSGVLEGEGISSAADGVIASIWGSRDRGPAIAPQPSGRTRPEIVARAARRTPA